MVFMGAEPQRQLPVTVATEDAGSQAAGTAFLVRERTVSNPCVFREQRPSLVEIAEYLFTRFSCFSTADTGE